MKDTLVLTADPGPGRPAGPLQAPSFLAMSDLLEAAIADARALDPRIYQPNYITFHSAAALTQCQVCLAGSLIAGTLQATPDESFAPEHFDRTTRGNLQALDFIRRGHWVLAFYEFHRYWPRSPIEDRLRKIQKPAHSDFQCWNTFRSHLDSLESSLPELREIELSQVWR